VKALRLIPLLLLLSSFAAAQWQYGQWTVYQSDVATAQLDGNGNPTGNIIVTPTVGITGDDGGFCGAFYSYEFPSVMLNGNNWVQGTAYPGAGMGPPWSAGMSFSYTFPNIIMSPGQTVDMSFAAKVSGFCYHRYYSGGYAISGGFYLRPFLDGEAENDPLGDPIPPTVCWLEGYADNTPECPLPWPPVTTGMGEWDLGSQQVAQLARISTTYWGPPVTKTNDLCYWGSLACSAGTTATCTHGYGFTFAPACPNYVKAEWLVVNGSCVPIPYVQAASGPGPCD